MNWNSFMRAYDENNKKKDDSRRLRVEATMTESGPHDTFLTPAHLELEEQSDDDGDNSTGDNMNSSRPFARRLQGAKMYKRFRLSVTYVVADGGSIMEEGTLGLVHSIERQLTS